jgi:diketogulonate reductase-like aldo/keto reductase
VGQAYGRSKGKLRAIGISNFYPVLMVDIASFSRIRPIVNQVETHLFNQPSAAKEYMDKYNVQIKALDKLERSFFSHYAPVMVELVYKKEKSTMTTARKRNCSKTMAGTFVPAIVLLRYLYP